MGEGGPANALPEFYPMTISKHTTTEAPAPAVTLQKEHLTAKEAADYLGISKVTLDAMRAAGTGPLYCRVSQRRVTYPLDGLKAYVAARIVTPSVR
jgi:predicted DNA-binding transcriptional regulator AlpA